MNNKIIDNILKEMAEQAIDGMALANASGIKPEVLLKILKREKEIEYLELERISKVFSKDVLYFLDNPRDIAEAVEIAEFLKKSKNKVIKEQFRIGEDIGYQLCKELELGFLDQEL